jgi:hypothetical protein
MEESDHKRDDGASPAYVSQAPERNNLRAEGLEEGDGVTNGVLTDTSEEDDDDIFENGWEEWLEEATRHLTVTEADDLGYEADHNLNT